MRLSAILVFGSALTVFGQTPPTTPETTESRAGWRRVDSTEPEKAAVSVEKNKKDDTQVKTFTVLTGTKVPMSMINSVSTKQAVEGDRVYLETIFPVLVDGKIVIPPGSYVAGTITDSKRPGKVKGKAELFVRFDSLTLPNGVTREFKSRIGSLDGRSSEELDKNEGRIKGEGNKSGDARTVGETAGAGATIGALGGAMGGHAGMGAGIGAAAGAAAGLLGVMLSRGPDAVLAKGTTLEMVLDRDLVYEAEELDFRGSTARRTNTDNSGPLPSRKQQKTYPGRRSPLGLPY